jgi:hypothetical protein
MAEEEIASPNEPVEPQQEPHQDPTAPKRKKPYEKPAIVYQAPLEAMAQACIHTPTHGHKPGKAEAKYCSHPLQS